jgi:hypothetical protein
MFQGPQILTDLPALNFLQVSKIALLILIIIYAIFSFMIYVKIRALTRIVIFPSKTKSSSIPTLAFIYFLLVVSLFFLALVIV